MIPHHRLSFIRNRFRARELREFRKWVEVWFEHSERDPDDNLADWEGAQAVRSHINRMLPRVVQVVAAAGIGTPLALGAVTDPGVPLGRAEVLQRIFTVRAGDGGDQEILDVIDMAIGVYDGDQAPALMRSLNPFYYAGRLVAFLWSGPRRFFRALGLGRGRALDEARLARLEAAASRLARVEDVIDTRLAALQDHQSRHRADQARQLAELAERLDFVERVLAAPPPSRRLGAPEEPDRVTPV